MKIIGISGKKTHGKSLVADYISLYKPNVIVYNFADELKKEVANACGVTVEHINENKLMFRSVLQWWGTDFRRKQDKDYWVKKWYTAISNIQHWQPATLIVAADVRFYNELKLIEQLGGEVWVVIRKGFPLEGGDDKHESETALDGNLWKHFIMNYGTKEDLAREVLKKLNGK